MLQKGNGVIIGLSGGADSVALFLLLCELRASFSLKLCAVHLNHGIRGSEADEDESFCKKLCAEYETEFVSRKDDIPAVAAAEGITVEEAGRKRRYEFFEEIRSERSADKIAVAHNRNDNAETVLHRILRGTGIKGLAGIPPVRGNIVRPLLGCGREEIEEYIAAAGKSFRSDSTNFQNDYTRNKIRNVLIPYLERDFNGSVTEALLRLSELSSERESFTQRIVSERFRLCSSDENGSLSVKIAELNKNDVFIVKEIIRLALKTAAKSLKDIDMRHIDAVLDIKDGKTGRKIELPYGLTARKSYERLIIENRMKENSELCLSCEPGKKTIVPDSGISVLLSLEEKQFGFSELLCTKIFDYDKITDELTVRTRQNGDLFTKKLKDWFIDKKTDRERRAFIPLLCSGKNVLVILDDSEKINFAANGKFFADKQSKALLYAYIFRED